MTGIPLIDIAPYLAGSGGRAVAQAVDEACREIGFMAITGHGIAPALLDDWFAASKQFFDLPLAAKQAVEPPPGDHHHGYHRMLASGLALGEGNATPPDLREYFMSSRPDVSAAYFQAPAARRFYHPNIWPARPAALRAAGEAYYAAVEALGRRLMRLCALALTLPEDYFDRHVDRHFGVLSTIHYPPQATPPSPGQLRAGAHTDYGSLTILAPTAAPGGLQVLDKAGAWQDVPFIPGAFVINVGDMLARWTNDRWVSTMHRVVNPPAAVAAGSARQSTAYFLHPNYDSLVECLPGAGAAKYRPVLAGDYMLAKESRMAIAE